MSLLVKILTSLGAVSLIIGLGKKYLPDYLSRLLGSKITSLLDLESQDPQERALVAQIGLDLVKLAEYKLGPGKGAEKFDAVMAVLINLLPPSIAGAVKPYQQSLEELVEASVDAMEKEAEKDLGVQGPGPISHS